MPKRFVPIRVDVGRYHHHIREHLGFLPATSTLLTQCVIGNALFDRKVIFDYLSYICGQVYRENQNYIEETIHLLCDQLLNNVTQFIPVALLNFVEVIPITDGALDCNVYIELNDQSAAHIPAPYHAIAVDEFAVRIVAGQYSYAVPWAKRGAVLLLQGTHLRSHREHAL